MAPGVPAATGSLATKPLAHLLVYALDTELNGSFEFVRPDGTEAGTMLVRRGCPSKIRTFGPAVYLSGVLLELGYVDQAKLGASLGEATAQRLPHGQVLLAKGWIQPDQLTHALRTQTQRKLAHFFALPADTVFAFHDGLDMLSTWGGVDSVLTDPFPAIWRGVRDVPPEDHVRSLLARAGQSQFRVTAAARIDRFDFSREELGLVEHMRAGEASISELAATSISPPRIVQLLVYCLLITKQIEVAAAPTSVPAAGSGRLSSPSVNPGGAPSRPSRPTVVRSNFELPVSVRAPPAAPSQGSPVSMRPAAAASSHPGSMPPQSRASGELSPREKAIVERARTIHNEDYFQRLSVARDAPPERIDAAFQAIARLWDGNSQSPAVREECAVVHAALVEAHDTLRDKEKRDAYMRKLMLGLAHQVDPAADLKASGADNELEGAQKCLDKGDLDRAERLIRRALKAKPDHAPTIALNAWIEAQRPANQTTDGTKGRILKLDRAVRADPECEEALFYRGMLYMRIEEFPRARADFAALVELNPGHTAAARELKSCEGRGSSGALRGAAKGKAGGAGGFLDRLLKK